MINTSPIKDAFTMVTRGFAPDMEKEFVVFYAQSSLVISRVAIILGMLLYGAFGILDLWIVPETRDITWLIRFAIVIPFLAIILGISVTSFYLKAMQPLLASIALIAGLGIIAMIGFAQPHELGFDYYYAGLLLVLMWGYVLARLRFIYATPVALLITAAYELIAIFINDMVSTTELTTIFINNNFFFIGANIIGMVTGFTIEYYIRKNFLLRNEIEKAFTMNKKYLDTVNEGMVLLDRNYNIPGQYSRFMLDLFGKNSIANINFIDLLYPDEKKQKEDRKELEKFLALLFNNTTADMDMLLDVNPLINKRINVDLDNLATKELIISASFTRVMSRDTVESILVIIQDRTALARFEEELAAEKSKHKKDVETIAAVLNIGPASFLDFIQEAREAMDNLDTNIQSLDEPEKVNALFRDLHSLKGLAKHLELHEMSNTAHLIEDVLDSIRNNQKRKPEQYTINKLVSLKKILKSDLERVDNLMEKFTTFAEVADNPMRRKDDLIPFINSTRKMATAMAEELGKKIIFNAESKINSLPHFRDIKNIIIHSVRNAIDHGIEDTFQRLSLRKDETGTITLTIDKSGSTYTITIEDDGGGIDFDAIKAKAIASGHLDPNAEPTRAQILSLLFKPNFSSKDTVTKYSGRGVGLDVVKETLESLGGKIKVSSKKNIGTKMVFILPAHDQN